MHRSRFDGFGRRAVGKESDGVYGDFQEAPIPASANPATDGSRDRASGGAGDVLRWRSERELPETCIDRIDEFGRRAVGRESDGVHGDFLQTPIPASANPEPADGYT
jgi:hypothetical protein